MIEPKPEDVGRAVIYSHSVLERKHRGKLAALTDDPRWVRVEFQSDDGSETPPLVTACAQLDWAKA